MRMGARRTALRHLRIRLVDTLTYGKFTDVAIEDTAVLSRPVDRGSALHPVAKIERTAAVGIADPITPDVPHVGLTLE